LNGGTLILDDVQILRSSAPGWSGGAIWSSPLSILEIRNSRFVDNDAAKRGRHLGRRQHAGGDRRQRVRGE